MIKVLLPRALLAVTTILSNTTLELICDVYTKVEADGCYLSSVAPTVDLTVNSLTTGFLQTLLLQRRGGPADQSSVGIVARNAGATGDAAACR